MKTVDQNAQMLMDNMAKKVASRPSANWRTHSDVDWEDLEFYVGQCRTRPDKDNFDTALKVLEALKDQVLNRKPNT